MDKFYAQLILAFLVFISFLKMVYHDFYGREAQEPLGFLGFVSSLMAIGIAFAVYYYAGGFSEILPKW